MRILITYVVMALILWSVSWISAYEVISPSTVFLDFWSAALALCSFTGATAATIGAAVSAIEMAYEN